MVQACSYKSKIDSNYYCQKVKFSCIESNKVVNFKTSKGDFAVKLFGKDNPVTVSNFLENIENNIYVIQKFYKIINYYQIKNPSETVNLVNTFESGSIAMVKSGKNKSSSTEFFFVTTKIPELDGRYSIFGKIIKGLDVLEKINKEDFIKAVQISN